MVTLKFKKAIDAAKTGVIYNIPRHIAKYRKPLPYFMKYASDYYRTLHKFAKTNCNMNRLCFEIEKWEKRFRYKRTYKDFDYKIMIDDSIEFNEERFKAIERIYLEFNKEMADLSKEMAMFKNYDKYKDDLANWVDKKTASEFVVNWNYYYDLYRKRCKEICDNSKELANYAAILCYEKYPARNKKFLWQVAGEGIIANIKPIDIYLPLRDDNGEYEYLGKKYSLSLHNEGNNLAKEGENAIDQRDLRSDTILERREYQQEGLDEDMLSSGEVL